jgi:hypothetical protein
MRLGFLAVTTVLACGAAVAAHKQESVTYVSGNLTGVLPNSGGSLLLSGDSALELKTGLSSVAIPYSGITKAELGAVREHSDSEPLYKVWAIHKRFSKSETQLLKVDFMDSEGEEKTLTVELDKSAAAGVVEAIQEHNPSVASNVKSRVAASHNAKPDAWWGDSYWKTSRNADQWPKQGQKPPQ